MKVAASLRSMTRSQLFWHSLSHIRRFSPLRMTIRESDVSQSLSLLVLSLATNHQSLISSNNTSAANL